MKRIMTLDCTLRDGGYCNQWRFGENNIKKIINGLVASNVDMIECGFLTDKLQYDKNCTKFTEINQAEAFIPLHEDKTKFVMMINYGEYDFSLLQNSADTLINGIRISFHKNSWEKAVDESRILIEKGYQVFLQPMISMLYSHEEFIALINMANKLKPYAFYIVDSFGMMNKKSLVNYYKLVEQYLDGDIVIGFHSHNNMQSAYANAQSLIEYESERTMIIDSSIYGMGRGAGNLNSELFFYELNNQIGADYDIKPLLRVMDEVLARFYEENAWGYSLPNYLSAVHMIHPDYAGFLVKKKTLTIEDMDEIFSLMDPEKGVEYDEKYIDDLYIKYMSAGVERCGHLQEIKEKVRDKKILIIAPGRTALIEQEAIKSYIDEFFPIVISVNHEYTLTTTDYIFVSNKRRFAELDRQLYYKTISTSNIKSRETYASIDYYKLLNTIEDVRDNAVLMAIRFAVDDLAAENVVLAGVDGFSYDIYANYESDEMINGVSYEHMKKINSGMRKVIDEYSGRVNISFLTTSIFKK